MCAAMVKSFLKLYLSLTYGLWAYVFLKRGSAFWMGPQAGELGQ